MKRENLEYYKKMLLIRLFEEKVGWLFSRDLLPGTAHLCIGQEAVAVGAVSAIKKNDYVFSNHRGHGHFLAKGADLKKLMCEIMGKSSGYCKGKGGTQHLCATDINFLGTNGITAGGIPIATGAALSMKLQRLRRVVLCFFGDGASNQGTFHESLNMASIWNLPIIYICENNLYAMSTPVEETMAIKDISIRAKSYNMASEAVDGMDLFKVKRAVSKAAKRAESGKGPTLIEAKTYRFLGHSKSDQRKYRSKEEESRWRKKDPILKFEKLLEADGFSKQYLLSVRRGIEDLIEQSYEYSLKESCDLTTVSEGVFFDAAN